MGERERERESGGRKGDREEGEGESERKDELVTYPYLLLQQPHSLANCCFCIQ